jgi:hypothetical protein
MADHLFTVKIQIDSGVNELNKDLPSIVFLPTI